MYFKLLVIANELEDHFVDTIVHFNEFLQFIRLGCENFNAYFRLTIFYLLAIAILPHKEEKLKQ